MRKTLSCTRLAGVLLLCTGTCALAPAAHAAKLSVSCGAVGQELEMCRQGAEAWAKRTGNEVTVVQTPNDATERLALYQQILNSKSDRIDVYVIDVVWPGLLASHFVDLKKYSKGAEKEHFPSIVANNTVGGKLVAMPWFTDAGLLYYRKDLLDKHGAAVPKTWDELAAAAKKVQDAERKDGNDKMWGYVWQGRAYEGLACNALEWVASFNGGTVVDDKGKVTINNPGAIQALKTARSWIGSITPDGVLNYAEEDARGLFQSGNAVFMRNWPYAWSLAQSADSPIRGKVGVAPLPAGANGKPAATLGGAQLAVSRYSKNVDLAADLVMSLASKEVQKERAIKGSFNPTIGALYKDADITKANPFMAELYEVFTHAVARPATVTKSRYNQVSSAFFNTAHEVLAGQAAADKAVPALAQQLDRVGRGGRW